MREKRQRKADNLSVPDISGDAAERKRVLNVLAQRRYRKRKREQFAALETRLKAKSRNDGGTPGSAERQEAASTEIPSSGFFAPLDCSTMAVNQTEGIISDAPASLQEVISDPLAFALTTSFDSESGFIDPANLQGFTAPYISPPSSSGSRSKSGEFSASGFPSPPAISFDSSKPVLSENDISALTFDFLGNTLPLGQMPTLDLSSTLQCHQSSTFSFPDDHLLEIPTLTLLRAMLTVASRLNVADYIWNHTSMSPFYTGPGGLDRSSTSPSGGPPAVENLPPHLRPTPTQRLVPHHPILDLFPWPTTRDRLIQVFSIPAEFRPPAAADPLGLIGLVYDVEDSTEGMRISGADPFAPDMWEVGQHVFKRWWWAFESSILERSNRLRRERGVQGLVLGDVD